LTIAPRTYAVIGTSEGALALAAELRLAGCRVILSDCKARRDSIESLIAAPGLDLDCQVESFVGGKQQILVTGIQVTRDLAFAAAEGDVTILMTPQTAYEELRVNELKNFALIASSYSRDELLAEPGVGPATVEQIKAWLVANTLAFRSADETS
jgi:hypothetical protein